MLRARRGVGQRCRRVGVDQAVGVSGPEGIRRADQRAEHGERRRLPGKFAWRRRGAQRGKRTGHRAQRVWEARRSPGVQRLSGQQRIEVPSELRIGTPSRRKAIWHVIIRNAISAQSVTPARDVTSARPKAGPRSACRLGSPSWPRGRRRYREEELTALRSWRDRLAGRWSLLAAVAFSGTALTWLVFADAIAVGVLALADLAAHAATAERIVHALEVRDPAHDGRIAA
jgi:hypothetical protein